MKCVVWVFIDIEKSFLAGLSVVSSCVGREATFVVFLWSSLKLWELSLLRLAY